MKLLPLLFISFLSYSQNSFKDQIDTLLELSILNYEDASEMLNSYTYTEEYDFNEFVSPDESYSIVLDTAEVVQFPSLIFSYSKKVANQLKDDLLIRGVLVEEYKDEDKADCFSYEGVEHEYLLVLDKRNDIIILTVGKYEE